MTTDSPDGPFHRSRTSDGKAEWFSARDAASGVSIPAKSREDADALVSSLNRACVAFARRPDRSPAGEVLHWEVLHSSYCYRAAAPLFGSIRVERYGEGPWLVQWSVPGSCYPLIDAEFDSAVDAMEAADQYVRAALSPAPAPEREGPQWDSRSYRLGYASGRSGRTPEVDALRMALFEIGSLPGTEVGTIKARRIAAAALAAYEGKKDG